MSFRFKLLDSKIVFAWLPVDLWVYCGGGRWGCSGRRVWLRWVKRCKVAEGQFVYFELRRVR